MRHRPATKTILLWSLVAFLWALYLVLIYFVYSTHPDGAGDYIAYDRGARALNSGQLLYSGIYGNKPYIYPPLLAILLMPITAFLDFRGAALAWLLLNIIWLVGTLYIISRNLPLGRLKYLFWLLPVVYTPVLMSFWHGQATILMFALVVIAWATYRHGNRRWTGLFLATSMFIKIYPVVLIAYFFWKRDWKVVGSALAASIGLGLVQWAVVGTQNIAMFVTTVLPELAVTGQTTIYYAHVGIVGFAARLFTRVDYVQSFIENQILFWLTRIGLSAFVIGTMLVLSKRTFKSQTFDVGIFDLEYALWLISALLLMSAIADSGLIPLVLVFAILLHQPRPNGMLRLACLAAFLLSPIDLILRLGYIADQESRISALALSTSFFSTALLWGFTALRLIKVHSPSIGKASIRTAIDG